MSEKRKSERHKKRVNKRVKTQNQKCFFLFNTELLPTVTFSEFLSGYTHNSQAW